jgi:uncharacterized Tic20 family protein
METDIDTIHESESLLIGGITAKNWALIIHLSQYSVFFLPISWGILPLILWLSLRKRAAVIDQQGRVVINWLLTVLLVDIVTFKFLFDHLGLKVFYLFGTMALLGIIFPAIGYSRGENGEIWPYPLSIPFFKVHRTEDSEPF